MSEISRNGGNVWTPGELQDLHRLVNEGFSAGQISRAIGNTHTRNSVMGKIHRLGLQLARPPAVSNVPRPRSQKSSVPGTRNGGDPIAPTPLPVHVPPAESVPMLLRDAGTCNCRFPMWDGDCPQEPTVCGAHTTVFGGSWCSHHAKLVFGHGTHSERCAVSGARYANKLEQRVEDTAA